jgi:hypothetical protein
MHTSSRLTKCILILHILSIFYLLLKYLVIYRFLGGRQENHQSIIVVHVLRLFLASVMETASHI